MITPIEWAGALITHTEAGSGTCPLRNNVGYHVGDDAQAVAKRRDHLSKLTGSPLTWMDQTHSTRVRVVDAISDHIDADALVVNLAEGPRTGLAVMVADCVPVCLSVAHGTILAAIHAGRTGRWNTQRDSSPDSPHERGADQRLCRCLHMWPMLRGGPRAVGRRSSRSTTYVYPHQLGHPRP